MTHKTRFILKAVVLMTAVITIHACKTAEYHKNSGFIFGTSYNITYLNENDLQKDIDSVLQKVDYSLSPFNKQSLITAINENRDTVVDTYMREVFTLAETINADTHGAFDITVAPLVNAWGFGFKNGKMPTDSDIKEICSHVGFNKVRLTDNHIIKDDTLTMLDCSAIAKGYAVDKVAEMLEDRGSKDYMVEIGGEIICKGMNPQGRQWMVGVIKPEEDSLSTNGELQTRLELTDIAMATSGNYRNFYYKGGRKYAHTIDPMTGYPVQHNILSATVLAPTCAMADAYATSFMVVGLNEAKRILDRHSDMMAYIIYTDEQGAYSVWYSPAMKEHIEK